MISYIDTAKVESIAKNISRQATVLESYLNGLFRRLDNVPDVTKEWIGSQSKAYFSRISQDKKQYISLVNDIKEISNELAATANKANITIKKLN